MPSDTKGRVKSLEHLIVHLVYNSEHYGAFLELNDVIFLHDLLFVYISMDFASKLCMYVM